MPRFLWVCLAGALGTGARYWIQSLGVRVTGSAFPYGTLLVNLLGSFAICLAVELATARRVIDPSWLVVVTTGFLGGFTTYSAFNYETLKLLERQERAAAFAYVGLTLLGSLLLGALGLWLGRELGD